ncbi:MAG: FomA family porin-like outer membrane protein [Cetobacterium sp.]|uniref:FomA family porin-like outer membrane protein n=1 Tax=Cetobacterium sp. TaxID=2071632 RepID=UPI003F312D5F
MKKLALLLGSLLVVGATASAKEAVVAPVEVSKEVVVVAEPVVEVVVEEAFRPTGYIGLEYKAFGNTEGHNDQAVKTGDSPDDWNRGNNNYSRLETSFGIQVTEKFKFEGRIRDFNNLDRNDATSDTESSRSEATETRLRFSYKHNDVMTSRFQYRDEENNSQNFEYVLFNTIYQNKGGLLSSVYVAPIFYHSMPKDGGGDYYNQLELEFGYTGNLPLGFTYSGTVGFQQRFYNLDKLTVDAAGKKKDKEFNLEVEFDVARTFALYTAENYNIDLNLSAGFDDYNFSQYAGYTDTKRTSDKNTYEAYAATDVTLTYQLTPALSMNTGIGAEYRNWDNSNESSANNWRWQPFAFAGMKAKF